MGNQVKRLRVERGWSQAELGRRIGVSRQAIISIEKGHSLPSLTAALRLGRALEAKVEDLFTAGPEDIARWKAGFNSGGKRGLIR